MSTAHNHPPRFRSHRPGSLVSISAFTLMPHDTQSVFLRNIYWWEWRIPNNGGLCQDSKELAGGERLT